MPMLQEGTDSSVLATDWRAASVVFLERSGLMVQLTAPGTWFTELEFKTADAGDGYPSALRGDASGVSSAARQACVAAAATAVANADGGEDEGGDEQLRPDEESPLVALAGLEGFAHCAGDGDDGLEAVDDVAGTAEAAADAERPRAWAMVEGQRVHKSTVVRQLFSQFTSADGTRRVQSKYMGAASSANADSVFQEEGEVLCKGDPIASLVTYDCWQALAVCSVAQFVSGKDEEHPFSLPLANIQDAGNTISCQVLHLVPIAPRAASEARPSNAVASEDSCWE
jgi:hypothetical protein